MIGQTFLGRYEVHRLLGEGGMGRVYLARQTDLHRQVVVKVMHDHIASDPKFRDRFRRETELMARFEHPNAVRLYDASLSDPAGPCIVMEYVKGQNLETLLAKAKRMTAPRVSRIIGQLCEVLQAAHEQGIIHRDLKPANLMILDADSPKERVKVMDFGLAKLIDDGPCERVTDTNVDFAVGTPGYIAPEQVRGEALDHRGDLYSVGVMAYELLAGRLPFTGSNSMDVLLAHATDPPPRFADLGLGGWVPPGVERVVLDCLAKDPDDRPQTARDLAERFEAAVAQAAREADARLPKPDTGSQDVITLQPAAPETVPLAGRTPPPARDDRVLPFQMDAWMPEAIALMKLRGFVHDSGGEVVESVPGLVRVRLARTPNSNWLFGRRASGPLDVELHLHRTDPRQANKLSLRILFRPSHPSLLADDQWKGRCEKAFVELRSYLMGGVAAV
jgi:serine/threonine-protein kinase